MKPSQQAINLAWLSNVPELVGYAPPKAMKKSNISHSPNYPLRKVVQVTFCQSKYSKSGYGTNVFTLECGHQAYAKYSQGEPKRKRCRDCWFPTV